jgi:hypothetical protein
MTLLARRDITRLGYPDVCVLALEELGEELWAAWTLEREACVRRRMSGERAAALPTAP